MIRPTPFTPKTPPPPPPPPPPQKVRSSNSSSRSSATAGKTHQAAFGNQNTLSSTSRTMPSISRSTLSRLQNKPIQIPAKKSTAPKSSWQEFTDRFSDERAENKFFPSQLNKNNLGKAALNDLEKAASNKISEVRAFKSMQAKKLMDALLQEPDLSNPLDTELLNPASEAFKEAFRQQTAKDKSRTMEKLGKAVQSAAKTVSKTKDGKTIEEHAVRKNPETNRDMVSRIEIEPASVKEADAVSKYVEIMKSALDMKEGDMPSLDEAAKKLNDKLKYLREKLNQRDRFSDLIEDPEIGDPSFVSLQLDTMNESIAKLENEIQSDIQKVYDEFKSYTHQEFNSGDAKKMLDTISENFKNDPNQKEKFETLQNIMRGDTSKIEELCDIQKWGCIGLILLWLLNQWLENENKETQEHIEKQLTESVKIVGTIDKVVTEMDKTLKELNSDINASATHISDLEREIKKDSTSIELTMKKIGSEQGVLSNIFGTKGISEDELKNLKEHRTSLESALQTEKQQLEELQKLKHNLGHLQAQIAETIDYSGKNGWHSKMENERNLLKSTEAKIDDSLGKIHFIGKRLAKIYDKTVTQSKELHKDILGDVNAPEVGTVHYYQKQVRHIQTVLLHQQERKRPSVSGADRTKIENVD